MRDFDYAVAPVRLLTPEMVQMLGKIHEYKGRQDILLNFYKDGDRLPADVEKNEDADYVNVYRLICSNYDSIMPTPREFLQIHRKLCASGLKASQAGGGASAASEPEDDGTFDVRAMLKSKAQDTAQSGAKTAIQGTPEAAASDVKPSVGRDFGKGDTSANEGEFEDDNSIFAIDESELPGFRKAGDMRPGLAHMRSAYLQRSGLRFRDTLQKARSSGIERVSTAVEMDPEETIENLCDEFILAWEEDRIDKLILIPMFFTDLMCIQPFESGNEKFCWSIALLLLLRAGYKIGKYVSLDSQIEKSRLTYTNVLMSSSEGWEEEQNNYSMFAAYFLSLVGQAYTEFEDSLKIPGEKRQKKPDRIRELIDARNAQITKKEIMQMFPDISKVTVERALTDLVKSGYIVKVGAGPSTAYVKADPVAGA